MCLISEARSGEFIDVKVVGTEDIDKDIDLVVEQILIHKKRPLRRIRRGQLGKKLICTPP
jgi:hypothetical protein